MTTRRWIKGAGCGAIARAALMLALGAGLGGVSAGCAGVDAAEREVAPSADDRLYDYRTVLRQLRADPFAPEAARELDLVEVWLGRAERLIAEDEEEELLELQLRAIEGQLVQVRAFYARREAEARLEASRSSYESRAAQIEQVRQRNDAELAPLEDRR